jgi:protein TonB
MDTINAHPSLKFLAVAGAAGLATLACFYLMFFLIANELDGPQVVEPVAQIAPEIAERLEEERPEPQRQKPEKIMPIDPPPDPAADPVNRSSWVELSAERPTFGSIADLLGPTDIQLELDAPHSELFAVNVVQPIYPLSAAMREIEGFVVVEFSVRENGTVSNPIVVQSEPEVLFDEAALNAVSKFKFKPREVGGDLVRADNIRLKFSFNLESLYALPEN